MANREPALGGADGRALKRLDGARANAEAGRGEIAVGAAYYAMLYAARAALSEEDLYAKTHSGTWDLFWQTFVESGRLDPELARRARGSQEVREDADYRAGSPSAQQTEEVVADAEHFVAAIERMLSPGTPPIR